MLSRGRACVFLYQVRGCVQDAHPGVSVRDGDEPGGGEGGAGEPGAAVQADVSGEQRANYRTKRRLLSPRGLSLPAQEAHSGLAPSFFH